MDNYLLMGHILNCKLVPKEKVHPELWIGANRRWKVVPRGRLASVMHNKVRMIFCCPALRIQVIDDLT